MNVQKYMTELSYLPLILGQNYRHRLHNTYRYTEDLRKIMARTRCSWVVERIFALQSNESACFDGIIQHWNLNIMPDRSVMFSCSDEQGRVVYYEHGYPDQPLQQDLAFIFHRNLLHVRA